jgi:cytochrome b subunit of formate dehydrogenase
MAMNGQLPPRLDILDELLDTVHPPVARLRILSAGMAPNHTLDAGRDIVGSEACLACGVCVDACPVIETAPREAVFVRTSMLLEHVVGRTCLRCFRCVAACPQVSPPLKEYVRSFRSVERGVHWLALLSYLVLATTGIVVYHWAEKLPVDFHGLLGMLHRVCGVGLLLATVLFFALDGRHARMALRRSLSWSQDDRAWAGGTWRWLISLGKEGSLDRGAFNPGQRLWYLYVPAAIAGLGVTGIIKWIGPDTLGRPVVASATSVHAAIALVTDVLLVLHVWLKVGAPWARRTSRRVHLLRSYRTFRVLRD